MRTFEKHGECLGLVVRGWRCSLLARKGAAASALTADAHIATLQLLSAAPHLLLALLQPHSALAHVKWAAIREQVGPGADQLRGGRGGRTQQLGIWREWHTCGISTREAMHMDAQGQHRSMAAGFAA